MRFRGRGEPADELFVEGELSPRARRRNHPVHSQAEQHVLPEVEQPVTVEANGGMGRELVLDRLTRLTEEVRALQAAVDGDGNPAVAPAGEAQPTEAETPEAEAREAEAREAEAREAEVHVSKPPVAPAAVPVPAASRNGEPGAPLSRAVADILASAEAAAAEIRAAAEADAARLREAAEADAARTRAEMIVRARLDAESEADRIMGELAADIKALAATLGGATKRALDDTERSAPE